MSRKIPYITKEKAEQIAKKYPTPFYLKPGSVNGPAW